MALTSLSLLPMKSIHISSSSSSLKIKTLLAFQSNSTTPIVCRLGTQNDCLGREPKSWRAIVSTALAAAVITFGSGEMSAMADLNKFEAAQRGEFGIGSAAQFGSADLKKAVHVNENFSC